MKTIKVVFNQDGSMQPVQADFKIYRGEYNQTELVVQMPKSLLKDTTNNAGNIVKVGAIIYKANGQADTTQDYNIPFVQEQTIGGIEYAIYCRNLPKEYTHWKTVATELGQKGQLNLVINLLHIRDDGDTTVAESILTSPIITLPVYPSVYLEETGEVEVGKLDQLASDVNTLKSDLLTLNASKLPINNINNLEANNTQTALEELEQKKVDKVQVEANKVLLSDGVGGIKASNVGIQQYEEQEEYIKQLHNEQEKRMNSMQEEISANTKDRHKHRDFERLESYTVSNTALLESVEKMHEHGNKEKLDAITEAFTTELKNNLEGAVSNIEFDGKTGIFTFIKNNGETVEVNTLLEKVIVNFRYDNATQSLILTSEDGSEQKIELGALLSLYTGSDGSEIAVTVGRDNSIGASIKAGAVSTNKLADNAVTEQKLDASIVDKLSKIVPAEEIVDLIYPIGIRVEFGEEFNPNKKWTWTEWERIEHGRFAKPVPEGQVGDTGGSETVSLTAENNGPHTHIQDGHNHGVTADRKFGGNGSGNWDWSGWDNGDRGGRNNQTIYSDTRQPAIHNSGAGKPFSIMNPYEGVAKWQRIR